MICIRERKSGDNAFKVFKGGGTVFAPPYSQLIYKEVSFTAEGVLITG